MTFSALGATDNIVTRGDVLDRADEVHIEAPTGARARQAQLPVSDRDLKIDDAVRLQGGTLVPMQDADSAEGLKSRIDVKGANAALAAGDLDRLEFQDKLSTMVVQAFAEDVPVARLEASQNEFLGYLKARKFSRATLSHVATKIRESLPPGDNRVYVLRRWLNAQGVKLFSRDRLSGEFVDDTFDCRGFKSAVDDLMGRQDVDRKDVRRLLARVSRVEDKKDLFAAKWAIQRRLNSGELHLAEPERRRLLGWFDEKLGGEVGRKEINYEIQCARQQGFDEAAMQRLETLLQRASIDPQAVFYVQEQFARQVQEAINGVGKRARQCKAAAGDHGAEQRFEHARTRFTQFVQNDEQVAPSIVGIINRRQLRRQTIDAYRAGTIARAETAGLMAAVTTSHTTDEFAYATMVLYARLELLEGWEELQKAWSEMLETFSRNMSDDEYDSSGNIIERGSEKHLRRELARRELERLRISSTRTTRLARRAWAKAGKLLYDNAVARAETPTQRDDLEAAQAAFMAVVDDVAPDTGGAGPAP